MKFIRSISAVLIVVLTSLVSCREVSDCSFSPADYVNPFIGASCNTTAAGVYHGLGKTFPGATTPYGMVQVSPNTITGGDNAPGYSSEHTSIEGFALTQMSGVGWYGELGNFLVTPTVGDLKVIAGTIDGEFDGYRSQFDKTTEVAEAGYYSADLTDYGINVQTSATPHCGILKMRYPQNDSSRVQIDLARRVGGSSVEQFVEVVDNHTIKGWMRCTPEGGGWGNGDGGVYYTLHFYAEFSVDIDNYGFWSAEIPDDLVRRKGTVDKPPYINQIAKAEVITGQSSIQGKHIGFYTEFPTDQDQEVTLKVGISFVDQAGAENNFKSEIADLSFDQVRSNAYQQWNRELSRIKIEGGDEDQKTIFYTALYHTMIDPRIYTDVDGRYVGGDGNIYSTNGEFLKRTIFSGWDVFRSQFPLQTIINPELVNDQINSLITLAEQSGNRYYERWEMLNAYSGCMLGNPAISVLADAYIKGIRNYDINKAYEFAVNSSKEFGNDETLGYAAVKSSISYTLEYAYTDWCIARLAEQLGKTGDVALYDRKSKAYANLFDKEKGWFRPKVDGEWVEWPENARLREWYGCVESNSYQQGWFVPHDVEGMVELMGGVDATLADLRSFFENTREDYLWNHYYNHANEPVHFVPFLFNQLGEPWDTQKWSRHICANAYQNRVEGLVGNEDAGQMSAWYVLTSSGIHPSCPGNTRMEITAPIFDKVVFKLDSKYASGDNFTVVAHNNSVENVYIQSAKLNGKEYNRCYIDFSEIAAGSTLELIMGSTPNRSWGVE